MVRGRPAISRRVSRTRALTGDLLLRYNGGRCAAIHRPHPRDVTIILFSRIDETKNGKIILYFGKENFFFSKKLLYSGGTVSGGNKKKKPRYSEHRLRSNGTNHNDDDVKR